MTGVCWWAFTYKREGFIPQMFGSIRVLCAATTQLDDFPSNGIQWGDLGEGQQFRHAGLAAEQVTKIVPNALYAGKDLNIRENGDDNVLAVSEPKGARRKSRRSAGNTNEAWPAPSESHCGGGSSSPRRGDVSARPTVTPEST